MAGCFLLVFIVSSVFIIVTTVNNNIYNYSYKYKKKHKLLNQISNWKKKKKKKKKNCQTFDVPKNSVLLRPTNSVPQRPTSEVPKRKKKKKNRLRPTNQVLVSKWKTKKKTYFRPNTSIDLLRDILLLFLWNNRKKKKKKNQSRPTKTNSVRFRPTNLLLLLLTMATATTYTVAANDLEGVIIRFAPHPNTDFPSLHTTLDDVYGLDLHDDEFHFLFHDVSNNQQTELYRDAPKRLLEHMISHITMESGSRGTRSKTDKVETLFKTMKLSYKMKSGKVMRFTRGQDLASGMVHFINHQREDVPHKCIEILLSISRIYPSPIGMVDGLDMDKLFSSQQAIPLPTAASVTAANAATNHLATIATTMSSAVSGATGLSSKAAAAHADADRDEPMDHKDMPPDLRDRYALKTHQVDIFQKSD